MKFNWFCYKKNISFLILNVILEFLSKMHTALNDYHRVGRYINVLRLWISWPIQFDNGAKGTKQTEKIKRIKTKLTNKLSKKDDLTWNRPITLVTPFYFFQSVWGQSGEMQTMNNVCIYSSVVVKSITVIIKYEPIKCSSSRFTWWNISYDFEEVEQCWCTLFFIGY